MIFSNIYPIFLQGGINLFQVLERNEKNDRFLVQNFYHTMSLEPNESTFEAFFELFSEEIEDISEMEDAKLYSVVGKWCDENKHTMDFDREIVVKDEESDEEERILCSVCAEECEEENSNCDKCSENICIDCLVYRPDMFGITPHDEWERNELEDGSCFLGCEVCTTCEKEFDDKKLDTVEGLVNILNYLLKSQPTKIIQNENGSLVISE